MLMGSDRGEYVESRPRTSIVFDVFNSGVPKVWTGTLISAALSKTSFFSLSSSDAVQCLPTDLGIHTYRGIYDPLHFLIPSLPFPFSKSSKRFFHHCLDTLKCLVATDEPGCVHKHAPVDARDAVELLVAEPPPYLGQGLAADKRVLGLGHALDAPLGAGRGALRVQDVQDRGVVALEREEVVLPGDALAVKDEHTALGVELRAAVKGALDDGAGRQPGLGVVVEVALKLLADAGAGGDEALVLSSLGLDGVGGFGVVPVGVEAADEGAEGEAAVAEALLDAGGGDGGRVVDGDTVVVGVEGLDKVLVQLFVEEIDVSSLLLVLGQAQALGDDGAAKVHEDQAGAGELGGAAGEGGCEAALVVVVAVALGVVLAADVDNGVAGLEDLGVAGTDEGRVAVGRQHAQHVDGEGLVGVEVAVVGADEGRARSLDAFRC